MGDYPPPNNSFRPSQQPSSTYSRAPFGSSGNSPPTPSFRSDIFGQTATKSSAQIYSTSPTAERHPADRVGIMPALGASTSDPSAFGVGHAPAVVIRRLPRTIGTEALKSMLIFAGDLIDVEFIRSPYPEDHGFATAVARFQTLGSAFEVQQKLNGKPNTTKEANMIVEAHGGGAAVGNFERRNTIDGIASRTQTSSASSASSNGGPGRSRFGSTFQSTEKISPPLPNATSAGEFPMPESSAHFQNLFSPQSPLANGDHRVSGKSMINDDAVDDETGELLKDPVAYAINGQQPLSRRTTNPQIPVGRFASLSLSSPSGVNTNMMAMTNGYTSPRGNPMQNGASPMTPTNGSNMTNGNYAPPNFPRPQYPPVNPADQNPPCNTLYVGNLPIDTSEDELKGLFSKQRGYKRLCFRTKQNGPMCFVEFEDISFATKALHELYGHPLHNSVKGGIRLSFSKNPLGVRSGQTNGMGANAVMSPQAMSPGYGGSMNGGNFSSVSGPPPGLGSPPGIMNGNPPGLMSGNGPALTNGAGPGYVNGNGGYRPQTAASIDGMFANPFGMPSPDFVGQIAPRNYSGGVPPALGSGTYGRDNRNGYNDFPDYGDFPNGNYPNGNYPNGNHPDDNYPNGPNGR